ncbi:MAG: uroporphyrinogen-III synthase [Acidobacteriota bacterium]|nr:uroporphyrinogen-III synthase [Acidobacteriota bacterium]
MTLQPLAGRRVLVTRAAKQAGKLSEGLRALGAIPVEVPVLEILPPEDFAPLDAALRQLNRYDWLILTSANAVRALVERASRAEISFKQSTPPQVAAVGQATAAEAEKSGLKVALVPESYVAESLISALSSQIAGRKVLLARATVARDVIPEALSNAGAIVDVVDAYRNAMPAAAPEQLRRALAEGIDAATFTSSSSATHLAEAAKQAGIAFPFADVPAISIGPITSQTLRELNCPPAAEANPYDIPGLIAAVVSLFSRMSS